MRFSIVLTMAQGMVIQGRNITVEEIGLIRDLMVEHRDWGRSRLSEELCLTWNWRNGQGRIKDMAARTLLLKLERRGLIELPARQRPSSSISATTAHRWSIMQASRFAGASAICGPCR